MFQVKILDPGNNEVEFFCKENQSLLDAARFQGIKIPYGCNGGGCGMCKVKVADGIFCRGTSSKVVLPDTERALNYTLACKTYPKSNMKVLIHAT